MKQWQVTLVVCSVIGLVIVALFIMWVADATPVHVVQEIEGVQYVNLLRKGTITDVSIIPSKERIHLNIHYDTHVTRHIDIETNGNRVHISPVRIKTTSVAARHFTDRSGTSWNWEESSTNCFAPSEGAPFYGAILYIPTSDTCMFIQSNEGRFLGRWIRR